MQQLPSKNLDKKPINPYKSVTLDHFMTSKKNIPRNKPKFPKNL